VRWPGRAIKPTSSGDGLEQVNSHLENVDKAYRLENFVDRAPKHAPTQGVDNTKLKRIGEQGIILNSSGESSSQEKGITCPSEACRTPPEPDPHEISNIEFSRWWEVEEQGTTDQQIVDVQGPLKKCIGLWTEVLQAPTQDSKWL